jgi:hypothetical protein
MCRRFIARRFANVRSFHNMLSSERGVGLVANLLNSVTSRLLLVQALTEQSTKLPGGALHRFRSFCEDGSKWPERAIG